MHIGVLETGPVASQLVEEYGSYTDFFRRLLTNADPSVTVTGWKVFDQVFPPKDTKVDGWIISGSKFGAYEDHLWIPPLEELLRQLYQQSQPIAGICFGHQILAQAFGGTVEKSEKGWGLGIQSYEFSQRPSWMKSAEGGFNGVAIHQDQVVDLPTEATVIAQNEFCEFAVLTYGDPESPKAISIQSHPEIGKAFFTDLVECRRGTVFNASLADDALASLSQSLDNDKWAKWLCDYFSMRNNQTP